MATSNKYPVPVFHFRVEWGGKNIAFSEVSGLTQELQVIEYRDGSSPDYSTIKMPGLQKYNNITMKRGIMKGDNDFFKWLNTVQLNSIDLALRLTTFRLIVSNYFQVGFCHYRSFLLFSISSIT